MTEPAPQDEDPSSAAAGSPRLDEDILLGKLALKYSFVTKEELETALSDQDHFTPGTHLGEILVAKEFITPDQLARLLDIQKKNLAQKDRVVKDRTRQEVLFGKIALRLKFVDETQLNWCLREQARQSEQGRFKRLGTYLVELGFMSHDQVQKVLEEQERGLCECPDCDKRFNIIGFDPRREYLCPHCKVPILRVGEDESDADEEVEDLRRLDLG